ncbi:hypothetical protein CRYUN_Cryun17cG0088300 [Craigia yunnanensis]
MLRRSILELSRRRGYPRRIPRQIISQRLSPFIYSRKHFSTSPRKNATLKPGSARGPFESKSGFSEVVLGSVVIGGVVLVAYQAGYLDQYLREGPEVSIDTTKIGSSEKDEKDIQVVSSYNEEINKLTPYVDLPEQKAATHIDLPTQPETLNEVPGENQSIVEDKSNETLEESTMPGPKKALPEHFQSSLPSSDHSVDVVVSVEGNLKSLSLKRHWYQTKKFKIFHWIPNQVHPLEKRKQKLYHLLLWRTDRRMNQGAEVPSLAPEESQIKTVPSLHPTTADISQDKPSKNIEAPSSLLDAYHLREKTDESYLTSLNGKYEQLSKDTEAFGTAIEELNEGYLSKDGKLVLNFLQAIHAAEKRLAELDAHAFAEEKQAFKEKYEKELRDSRAMELMCTEEAAYWLRL